MWMRLVFILIFLVAFVNPRGVLIKWVVSIDACLSHAQCYFQFHFDVGESENYSIENIDSTRPSSLSHSTRTNVCASVSKSIVEKAVFVFSAWADAMLLWLCHNATVRGRNTNLVARWQTEHFHSTSDKRHSIVWEHSSKMVCAVCWNIRKIPFHSVCMCAQQKTKENWRRAGAALSYDNTQTSGTH